MIFFILFLAYFFSTLSPLSHLIIIFYSIFCIITHMLSNLFQILYNTYSFFFTFLHLSLSAQYVIPLLAWYFAMSVIICNACLYHSNTSLYLPSLTQRFTMLPSVCLVFHSSFSLIFSHAHLCQPDALRSPFNSSQTSCGIWALQTLWQLGTSRVG